MRKYRFLFLLLVMGSAWPLLAQQDLSTHFLRHTWQANRTNPTFFPEYGLVVGLPGVYNGLTVEHLTYNTLFSADAQGQQVLDIDAAIASMKANNDIRNHLDIETLSFGARFGPLGLSLSHTFRFNAFSRYPKTMPQLIWQGNAQFIGETVDFAPQVELYGYQEFALGGMVDLGPAVSIGGRAKLLWGTGTLSSEQHRLRLNTDGEIYQLTLDADYRLNSSGALQYEDFDDVQTNFDFAAFSADRLTSSNLGFAFDLGAHVRLGKLELAASVLDIGSITWKEDVNNYSLQGNFEYEGLDFAQSIFDDTTSFGSVLDTLQARYEIVETEEEFQTSLPTRFYLSATLRLRDNWTVGGLLFGERYRDRTYAAAAVATNLQVLPVLNVGGIYAYRDGRFDNFGLNATVKLGPVQLLAATDNILTVFRPKDSNTANLRLGANLLFNALEPSTANGGPKFF